jgi:hypothetical protein
MPAKTIAVMQPYFFPYAGYFRLLHLADHFLIFDCVQFPRRGYVHRCTLPQRKPSWLTLPLSKQAVDHKIYQLTFRKNARAILDQRLDSIEWIQKASSPIADQLREYLYGPLHSVIDFLEQGLRLSAQILDIEIVISRSSELNLDNALKGQERVIAAVQQLHGSHYLNSPGGRKLYNTTDFNQAGIELVFLNYYHGLFLHMLHALMTRPPEAIKKDILQQCSLKPDVLSN